MPTCSRLGRLTIVAAGVLLLAGAVRASGSCEGDRYTAASRYAACEHKVLAKFFNRGIYDFAETFSKCRDKYAAAWWRIEAHAVGSGTICDGPRFVDNGDGTITDNLTALQWEEKTSPDGTPNAADPHDVDNTYSWSATGTAADGTAYSDFLPSLNGGSCFAGQCDWRLPTVVELQTIIARGPYPCEVTPCIDAIFGPTAGHDHWSSTIFGEGRAGLTWFVFFGKGAGPSAEGETAYNYVRAVRGGL